MPRRRPYLSAGLLTLLLLAACGQQTCLRRIEAIVQDHPDSALTLLQAVDTTALRPPRLQAQYHLFSAIASDKSHLDQGPSAGLTAQDADWYSKHPPRHLQHIVLYYLGDQAMISGRYDQAYSFLARSGEEAARQEDWFYAAMSNLRMASLYQLTELPQQAYEYASQAQNYFILAGDHEHFLTTGNRLVEAWIQLGKRRQAEAALDRIFHYVEEQGYYAYQQDILRETVGQYLRMTPPQPDSARSKLSRLRDVFGSFYSKDYALSAVAEELLGHPDRADRLLDSAYVSLTARDDRDFVREAEYRIRKNRGDSARALTLHEELRTREDSTRRATINTLVFNHQPEDMNTHLPALIAALILIGITGLLLWRSKKAEASLRRDLKALTDKSPDGESSKFLILEELCKVYDQPFLNKNERLLKHFSIMLARYREDPAFISRFEAQLDPGRRQLLARMHQDEQLFSPKDFPFVTYVVAGLSYNAIAVILGENTGTLYTRATRLRDRIRKSDSPDKVSYLQYLSSKSAN
jgi:tetratricopeptide (TPR) repeat protein